VNIDLGAKKKANVVYDGKTYPIDFPSIMQVDGFMDMLKKNKGKEHKAFQSFVISLGLPEDVSQRLDLDQYRKLADGLMGGLEKK
jgi:hypothetical protein